MNKIRRAIAPMLAGTLLITGMASANAHDDLLCPTYHGRDQVRVGCLIDPTADSTNVDGTVDTTLTVG